MTACGLCVGAPCPSSGQLARLALMLQDTHWFVSEGRRAVRAGGAPAGPESCGVIELLLTCPCDCGPQT